MSEEKYDSLSELSIDELIAEARQDLERGTSIPKEPLLPESLPPMEEPFSAQPPVVPEEDFVPDFGSAFDDYGELEETPPAGEEEDFPPEEPKRRRKRIVPLFVKVVLYLVVVAVISVGLGYGAWECAQDVLAFGRSDDTVQVTVPENASLDAIAEMLEEQGLIKYPWLFKLYCKFTHSTGDMEPGTYELSYNYDYHALVSGMRAGSANRTTVRVMIPEGSTCAQIFASMEAKPASAPWRNWRKAPPTRSLTTGSWRACPMGRPTGWRASFSRIPTISMWATIRTGCWTSC